MQLESGDDVVILKLPVMPESIGYRVRPRVALAWLEKEFPINSTRWEFPSTAD